ncbi:MAG: hypothetical protein ACI3XI_03575 [Eubacteriales bacterium]
MIITFAGHSKTNISSELRERIYTVLKENISTEHVTFYCGGYGAFDLACAHIVKAIKEGFPNTDSVFVTPYMDSSKLNEIKNSGLYDSILYPGLEHVPYRYAISKRNEFMVSKADLLICYVRSDFGGAYKTLMYAKQKKKRIIDLANNGL